MRPDAGIISCDFDVIPRFLKNTVVEVIPGFNSEMEPWESVDVLRDFSCML